MSISFSSYDVSLKLSNKRKLKVFINNLFASENKGCKELTYIFCTDSYLLKINKEFLKHDYYTDIITFDLSDNSDEVIGEVYISTDRVIENSKKYKSSFTDELLRVIFHGALHLCGFKDNNLEQQKMMRYKEDCYILLWKQYSST